MYLGSTRWATIAECRTGGLVGTWAHAADLVVAVGGVGREYVYLANDDLLLHFGQRVPVGQIAGPGRELRVGWNHAEALLVGEDLLAELLPALVEQVHLANPVDPLLGWLVRIVRRAGDVVDEERLVWSRRVQRPHVADGIVHHVGDEVVARLADPE